jgi:hypothetical protein
MSLPSEVVREDRRLEDAQESTFEALVAHRWHWTLDESNPERVPMREYARTLGRSERTIRGQVKGYADWRARAGARRLSDCIEMAGMGAETALAHEAVASARGVTVQTVREQRPVEVRHVREQARQRAEDRGTSVEEELPRTAEWVVRSERATQAHKNERARKTDLRLIEVASKVQRMIRLGVEVLDVMRTVEWDDDGREIMEDSLDKLRALVGLLDVALVGSSGVDWDAELRKLEEAR